MTKQNKLRKIVLLLLIVVFASLIACDGELTGIAEEYILLKITNNSSVTISTCIITQGSSAVYTNTSINTAPGYTNTFTVQKSSITTYSSTSLLLSDSTNSVMWTNVDYTEGDYITIVVGANSSTSTLTTNGIDYTATLYSF